MSSTTDLKQGLTILHKGNPWLIAVAQFVNPGKGSAFTRAKLRQLKTGQVVEHTFKSGEAVELVDVVRTKCQYLYNDGENYNFMDNETYEQFALDKESIGDATKYLVENTECYAMYIDGIPVSIQVPPKMTFKVISAPPGYKGDTATGGSKDATIETGATIKVPLFIEEGDLIMVNTAEGNYVSKG
ncbi:elongation factor P [Candidatus Gracilibacteria bacterium]|nr:elongation factor P [Candidatus Gracilibacteria bacterium]